MIRPGLFLQKTTYLIYIASRTNEGKRNMQRISPPPQDMNDAGEVDHDLPHDAAYSSEISLPMPGLQLHRQLSRAMPGLCVLGSIESFLRPGSRAGNRSLSGNAFGASILSTLRRETDCHGGIEFSRREISVAQLGRQLEPARSAAPAAVCLRRPYNKEWPVAL